MHATNLTTLIEARRREVAPLLFDRARAVSAAELADEAAKLARGLQTLGVRAGDRVAIWMPNVPAWLALFFACARLGAIAVSVNTRFRSHEVADIVGRSGAKVLAFWPAFKGLDFAGILSRCEASAFERLESIVVYSEVGDTAPPPVLLGKRVIRYEALADAAPHQGEPATGDAGCVIFTTSGTTKAPKFVLHDQRTVIGHGADVARGFALDASSIMFLAPPLCGVFGFCCAMAALVSGRPLVMRPVWDAELSAADIAAFGVTHLNASDDAVQQLLEQSRAEIPYPSVRFIGYAAFNPALGDLVDRAGARGLRLVGLYGTSEIQALFARQPEHAPASERMQGGGFPVSREARVRVRDPDTGRVLAHGEAGELEFFAPGSRMLEYFGNPEATAAAITPDGWYRSGDLGTTSADGRFTYVARMGDSLRLGGFLVSPAEIEEVVQQVPGVDGCQVVGVTHEGQPRAIAFVTLKPGGRLDERAALSHVGARLARYKVPARVFALDAFPVTTGSNGTKIQKGRLREMAAERLSA